MKVRFELNVRDNFEDIITFDFTQLMEWRTPDDEQLNKLITPKELYRIAVDIVNNPLSKWEEYSETTDEGEHIYDYPNGEYHVLFSVPYFREWKNKDRKYQLCIEGLPKGELCYAKYLR